ncbi:GDSL esterase/lipase CPRD49-like [Primulina huaijiensis]|uniref:GDSL esterase/lipase CPRD49-like n=1 Tax=Primulina huaijiensis TaxID=1492673 RepID=UPI003CC79920
MVGPNRPLLVLFGSSIVQMCYNVGGWGAMLLTSDTFYISIDSCAQSSKADVLLRGYSGWNSRMALQILDQVFPKVHVLDPSDVTLSNNVSLGPRLLETRILFLKIFYPCLSCSFVVPILEFGLQTHGFFIFLRRDGIHLSSDGSQVVLEELLKVLKRVDSEPSLYWLAMTPEFSEDSPYYAVGPDGKNTVNVSGHICTWQRHLLNIE